MRREDVRVELSGLFATVFLPLSTLFLSAVSDRPAWVVEWWLWMVRWWWTLCGCCADGSLFLPLRGGVLRWC